MLTTHTRGRSFTDGSLTRAPATHTASATGAAPLAGEAHRGTWTTLKTTRHTSDLDTLHLTHSGTKAGDPLADTTFNLAISNFITDLHTELANLGLQSAIDEYASHHTPTQGNAPTHPTPQPCFTISYVDDLTINIDHPDGTATIHNVVAAATAAQTTAHAHHFFLNTNPRKTEATLNMASPTARRLRKEIQALSTSYSCHLHRVPPPHTPT